MATDTIKLRTSLAGDVVEVKALIKHPMTSSAEVDKATGKNKDPLYIQTVVAEVNGTVVMSGNLSQAVSKNPYLAFKTPAKAGDKIKLSWTDNTGDKDSAEAAVA